MNLFDRDPGQAKERIQEKSQRRGYLILPGYVQLVSSKKKDNFHWKKTISQVLYMLARNTACRRHAIVVHLL